MRLSWPRPAREQPWESPTRIARRGWYRSCPVPPSRPAATLMSSRRDGAAVFPQTLRKRLWAKGSQDGRQHSKCPWCPSKRGQSPGGDASSKTGRRRWGCHSEPHCASNTRTVRTGRFDHIARKFRPYFGTVTFLLRAAMIVLDTHGSCGRGFGPSQTGGAVAGSAPIGGVLYSFVRWRPGRR